MHLGMSHLLCESFAVAHHNTYRYKNTKFTGCKFIGDMLAPHFINLIAINTLARETLVARVGDALKDFFGIAGKNFPYVFGKWYTEKEDLWNTNVGFYDDLRTRGFDENFKHGNKYRLFRDGKLVYDAINNYVTMAVNAFYKDDQAVRED
jgi:hypothetical protein